jgi:lipopolysaccharide export system protein LptA
MSAKPIRPRLHAALVLALLLAPCAHAELQDRDKPVNIEADRLSIDDKKKESVFEGNVTMTQGTLTLRADRVFVRQDGEGFNHAIAFGRPAAFKQKREGTDEYIEGFAERMEYDGKQDKVQLFTNAHVKKGIDEVKGDYISYDAVTEYYQVIGGGPGTASPANPQGRVRAVIQPKRREGESGVPGRRDEAPGTGTPPVPLQPSPGVGSR